MINIYRFSRDSDRAISQDGSFNNPFKFDLNTTTEQKYFIRGEIDKTYAGCVIYASDTENNLSSYFTFAEDSGGGAGSYSLTHLFELAANQELPVWVRGVIPADGILQVNIKIGYSEHS